MTPTIITDGGAAIVCRNLRPRTDGRPGLEAVGLPSKIASAGWRPLTQTADGRILVVAGRNIALVDPENYNLLREVGTAPSEPQCAASDSSGNVLIMCAEESLIFDKDTCAIRSTAIPDRYHLTLTCTDATPVAYTASPTLLSGDYTGEAALTETDRRRINDSLLEAYGALCRAASDAGVMLQPALARYRLLDNSERELYLSPPVLLSASSGRQCTGMFSLYSTSRTAMPTYTLTAATWRPRLEIPAGTIAPEVASVEVLMSPMLHTPDPSAAARAYTVRRTDSDEFLRVGLPGCLSAAAYKARIAKTCGRLEQLQQSVFTLHRPFATTEAQSIEIEPAPEADFKAEVRSLSAALARKPVGTSYVNSRLSAPHSFTAARAAQAAGAVLWGGLTAKRFGGYTPRTFARSLSSDAWSATVAVTFASGERLVSSFASDRACPLTFGPMLSYPSPDATEMEITLQRTGSAILTGRFPLQPDGSGRRSVWIDPLLGQVALTEQTLVQPEPVEPAPLNLPGAVAVASAELPLSPISQADTDLDEITALAPARLSQNSWDFGRRRFYIFGRGGTLSATVADGLGRISLNLLDKRPVADTDAVCHADGAVWVATAGGDILRIESSKVSTMKTATGACGLIYDHRRNELWARMADGSAIIFLPEKRMARYARPDLGISAFHNLPRRALTTCSKGLCDIADETYSPIDVGWEGLITFPGTKRHRLPGITIDLGAMNLSAKLSLTRRGPVMEAPAPDFAATLTGQILSAIRLPLCLIYPVRMLRLAISAQTSPDFTLTEITIENP